MQKREIVYDIRTKSTDPQSGKDILWCSFITELTTTKKWKKKARPNVDSDMIYVVGHFPKAEAGKQYRFTGEFKADQSYGQIFEAYDYNPVVLTGTIRRLTYYNSDSGYAIMLCDCKDWAEDERITMAGKLINAAVGQTHEFVGQFVDHKRYGRQFSFVRCNEHVAETKDEFIALLDGPDYPGLGKKMAEVIWDYFGDDTIEILNNAPSRLEEVPGMGPKKIIALQEAWENHSEDREVKGYLRGIGLTENMANKIYLQYGMQSKHVVQTNPYDLIDTINGIGFKKADEIAMKAGIAQNDPSRLKAAVRFILQQAAQYGHCYATMHDLLEAGEKNLGIRQIDMLAGIKAAHTDKQIYKYDGVFWLPEYLRAEKLVADYLKTIMATPGKRIDERHVQLVIRESEIEYADAQKKAIYDAADNKVLILTGGPGTGKSTVAKAILEVFDLAGLRTKLASPTGRAAKRLAESTGREAETIHRLLDFNPALEGRFGRNFENPLDCDALIIDEASMIDIELMNHLLEATLPDTRVVFIGDADQLPSVGPGNVLHDMIDSHVVPVRRLEVIFRQGENSGIIRAADDINHGRELRATSDNLNEFSFRIETEAEVIADKVIDIVKNYLDNGASLDDIQILYPQNKKPPFICTNDLNMRMQREFNNSGKVVPGTNFRVGDRVMQLKNDSSRDVYNGDQGKVNAVNEDEGTFDVLFSDNLVTYGIKATKDCADKDNLTLSYACTIHKSQGSEFPYVIMPFTKIIPMLRCRNLLYTGVTRAKKQVILIGDMSTVSAAIANNKQEPRRTMLKERLQK